MKTSELEKNIDRELDIGMSEIKKDRLIAHLKNIVNHRNTLESYINFYEEVEPRPTNNLILLDHECKIRYVSKKAKDLLGYQAEEDVKRILGTYYKNLIVDDTSRNIFENAIIRKDKVHIVGLLASKPGKPVYVRSRIVHYLKTNRDSLIGVALRIKKA